MNSEREKNALQRSYEYFIFCAVVPNMSTEHLTLRYLALVQADILHYKNTGKKLPEDFAEKVFSSMI
ncbi:MAG TPA: hypothetical protein PKG52_12155 [bacterium]|nr:hypothetical protein [bacterium]HPS31404.1 hypothetical protein [bacterium]